LQNKIKRSPVAYGPEFRQQMRSFDAQLSIFELSPPKDSKEFGKLVTFLSQVAYLYKEESKEFGGALLGLMDKSHEAMDPELRRTLFLALVLLRNRGMVDAVTLISLSFGLFRCKDKMLRELLYVHIVSDVRNVNKKASNVKLNKAIQNVVYRMLEDPSSIAAKKSLQVMVDLYKRRVWVDTRTVNVIADACLSSQPKIVAIALQFFLGIDEKIDALMDEEDEESLLMSVEAATGKSKEKLDRGATKSNQLHSKKTRKRLRKLAKENKAVRKMNSQQESSEGRRLAAPRFPAIELLNDAQGFIERLFRKLKSSNEHFEVRLMMMNLMSRVAGYHKLLILPFFSFMQRYLQPHQRHVTAILAYVIQACHDLVPAEDVEPLLRHVANNFVNDRSGSEVMAVGLNAIREMFVKIPLLTSTEGAADLIQDLVQYRRFRRDKSVVIAARSLLNCMRELNPSALARKERGKFHNSTSLKEYGESTAQEGVDGAELLQMLEEEARELGIAQGGEVEDEDDDDEEEEEEDDDDDDGEEEAGDDDVEGEAGSDEQGQNEDSDDDMEDEEEERPAISTGTLLERSKKRNIEQRDRIDAQRLLTDEDFQRIRKLKAKIEKEKRDPRARRKLERKTKVIKHRNAFLAQLEKQGFKIEGEEHAYDPDDISEEDDDPFDDDESSDDSDDEGVINDGSVNPYSLEGQVKKRRRELTDRLASIYEGRKGAHELNKNRTGGTSNLEKAKHKNYLMVSNSKKVKLKQNVSLRQQQMQLKRHVKNLEKSKKTVQKVRKRSNKSRS